jgi:S-adenosylmethionine hydrolase
MPFRPRSFRFAPLFAAVLAGCTGAPSGVLFLASDFGTADGAVAEMKGVALACDRSLVLHDLTHEIPAFDIWTGAHRIAMAVPYLPIGSVVVGVVDPGVGTERAPIAIATRSGHYLIGPDNGLFSVLERDVGFREVRTIDASQWRRPGSQLSHTFDGRDLFSYAGARLASGRLEFESLGPPLATPPIRLPLPSPGFVGGEYDPARPQVEGSVTVLDVRFGNVWTNVDAPWIERLGIVEGDYVEVVIRDHGAPIFQSDIPFVRTFGDVAEGKPLAYRNSLGALAFALNLGDFASKYQVLPGATTLVTVRKSAAARR